MSARARPSSRYDYVTIGHVTLDVIEDDPAGPRSQPGGGAFYSALQAARLGLRTLILTGGVPDEVQRLLAPYRDELDVRVLRSQSTTTLATWGKGDARVQCVRAWAGPIGQPPAGDAALDELSGAAIVQLAPVARETTSWTAIEGRFVGLTPQGLVRAWGADGRIGTTALDPHALPRRLDAVVMSEGERAACSPLLQRGDAIVAVTAGAAPVELCLPGGQRTYASPIAVHAAREDLGAGDVFAAAFFVALARGEPASRAARYASAAAAIRVAGVGPAAIGDRAKIERLLESDDPTHP